MQHGRITSVRPFNPMATPAEKPDINVIIKDEAGRRYAARVIPPNEQLNLFGEGRDEPVSDDRYVPRPPTLPEFVIEPAPFYALRSLGARPEGWSVVSIGHRSYVRRPARPSDPPERRVVWADAGHDYVEWIRLRNRRSATT